MLHEIPGPSRSIYIKRSALPGQKIKPLAFQYLLRRIKGSCKLLLCVQACLEPVNNFSLVLRTRKGGNCSGLNRDQGLVRVVGGEVTTGTTDTSGWSVMQEFSCVLGGESTDGGELLKMIVTANERERELFQEKK